MRDVDINMDPLIGAVGGAFFLLKMDFLFEVWFSLCHFQSLTGVFVTYSSPMSSHPYDDGDVIYFNDEQLCNMLKWPSCVRD